LRWTYGQGSAQLLSSGDDGNLVRVTQLFGVQKSVETVRASTASVLKFASAQSIALPTWSYAARESHAALRRWHTLSTLLPQQCSLHVGTHGSRGDTPANVGGLQRSASGIEATADQTRGGSSRGCHSQSEWFVRWRHSYTCLYRLTEVDVRRPPHPLVRGRLQPSVSWHRGSGTFLKKTSAVFATASLNGAARSARYLAMTVRRCGVRATTRFTCTALCAGLRTRAERTRSLSARCADGPGNSERNRGSVDARPARGWPAGCPGKT
jgi:hypothetical protein